MNTARDRYVHIAMGKGRLLLYALLIAHCALLPLYASSGTEGAAFLDIPVGAGPAAMGTAYTALANDAYAATYNPAGLGSVPSTQFSGQHLSYLENVHYEYLSFALPFNKSSCEGSCSALGGSVQYLGSGDIDGTDNFGNSNGTYSSYYAAYNLAYGRSFGEKLSLGLTSKLITARIEDVKATAYAADLGGLYKLNPQFTVATTLTNLGSKLNFLSEGDPLPLAFHLGAVYQPERHLLLSSEVVYPQTGLASVHVGVEWKALSLMTLRAGYRTDTIKEQSPIAGVSAGIGLNLWGQELSYAYLPYGDLGNTHYISLLMKFDKHEDNNIQKQAKAKPQAGQGPIRQAKAERVDRTEQSNPAPLNWRNMSGYKELWDLLNDIERQTELKREGDDVVGPI